MRPLQSLLLVLLPVVAACDGNVGDLFSIFPREVFDDGGGDGDGDGGVPIPFVPQEVGAMAGGQGVTGDVNNIALANVAGATYAFIAAGTDGVHVVDVTRPDLINTSDFVGTVRDAVLTAPAAIAGGAVHDLTVVDNIFLVCIAVGTGATNAVTVFNIPALISAFELTPNDLSPAFVPPAGAGDEIAVPGVAGEGGGVSGSGGDFFVATGGPALVRGELGGASWTVSASPPDLSAASPATITEVLVNQTTAIYATGTNTAGEYGLFSLAHPDFPVQPPATFVRVTGVFTGVIESDVVTGPGNYPLDLAHNTLSLYVTAEDEVFLYNVTTNPLAPALQTSVTGTGTNTIAVAAEGATFVVGNGETLEIATNAVGQARLTFSVSFPGTFTIRSSALLTISQGSFAFVCAGTAGMRVVALTRTQVP